MAGQEGAIGALGILIFAGVFSRLFLKKTGFSDVIILIIVGVLAGAFIPASVIAEAQKFMVPLGAVALLMIIMEEGLSLSLSDLFSHAHKALIFGVLSLVLSFVAVAGLLHYGLGLAPGVSFLIGAIFSSVAPELLSGFLSAASSSKSLQNIGRVETIFTEAASVIGSLLLLSGTLVLGVVSPGEIAVSLMTVVLFSAALGCAFALLWKVGMAKIEHENEHLTIIGFGALLYALSERLQGNGVIAVFSFAFLIGNSGGPSTEEVRRFQSEISFFMRTFFFVYLGALIFHSPKPMEIAAIAFAISLLLAAMRFIAGKILPLLDRSAESERVLQSVSSRGLTAAVLAIIAYQSLADSGIDPDIDLPLLALFVVFFTNLISAYMLLAKRKTRLYIHPPEGGVDSVLKGGLHGA